MRRLGERGITRAMLDFVLEEPEWTPLTTRNTRYDRTVPDGRRLCVVVATEHEPWVVVTAFWYEAR